MLFTVVTPGHPLRGKVEAQIRGVYSREYGAAVRAFPETLVALVDADGEPACAAGLRFAADGFFSERYLPRPIDAMLDRLWAGRVAREQIVEITSLAGTRPGACLLLFRNIVEMMRHEGVPWAFFTATDRLRAKLRRSGVPALDLAPAMAELVEDPAAWGSYYETDPRVCAVHDSMLSIVPAEAGVPAAEAAISA